MGPVLPFLSGRIFGLSGAYAILRATAHPPQDSREVYPRAYACMQWIIQTWALWASVGKCYIYLQSLHFWAHSYEKYDPLLANAF